VSQLLLAFLRFLTELVAFLLIFKSVNFLVNFSLSLLREGVDDFDDFLILRDKAVGPKDATELGQKAHASISDAIAGVLQDDLLQLNLRVLENCRQLRVINSHLGVVIDVEAIDDHFHSVDHHLLHSRVFMTR